MKDGAWLVVSLLSGGGAFYGGMRVAERSETKCVADVAVANARRETDATRASQPPRTPGAARPIPTGRLIISCTPSKNVSIRIDERVMGDVCPIEVDIAAGSRQIEIRAPHHRTARSSVNVEAAKTARVSVQLEDEAGLFYRPHIDFPELRAQAVDDLRDGKVAVISGEVQNRGERAVREIQLAVDFLDEGGGTLVRRFLHPVLEREGASVLPREAKRFALKVPDIPLATWSRKIRWSVSLIGLLENQPTGSPSGGAPR
ncbi:MAG: PEGA domain-containing protein [Deltaproteobacteria bacterium]|nr:PEGA domain-containing protein [Deltaproteobacteria bacterium]